MDRGSQQHHWIERKYQRVGADLPCELCFPEGGSAPARIINLSAGGLKFSCGQDTFSRLLPVDQRTPGQVTGVEIGIRFQFQSGHQAPTSLQLNVRVVHTERLAQDQYHVGVVFIDLDKSIARVLENYVEDCRKRQQA